MTPLMVASASARSLPPPFPEQLCQATKHFPGLSPPPRSASLRQVAGLRRSTSIWPGKACLAGTRQRHWKDSPGACTSEAWDTQTTLCPGKVADRDSQTVQIHHRGCFQGTSSSRCPRDMSIAVLGSRDTTPVSPLVPHTNKQATREIFCRNCR